MDLPLASRPVLAATETQSHGSVGQPEVLLHGELVTRNLTMKVEALRLGHETASATTTIMMVVMVVAKVVMVVMVAMVATVMVEIATTVKATEAYLAVPPHGNSKLLVLRVGMPDILAMVVIMPPLEWVLPQVSVRLLGAFLLRPPPQALVASMLSSNSMLEQLLHHPLRETRLLLLPATSLRPLLPLVLNRLRN